MPPNPLSYNMSDVNPHLTQCEPPPYIKAGSAPVEYDVRKDTNIEYSRQSLIKISESED